MVFFNYNNLICLVWVRDVVLSKFIVVGGVVVIRRDLGFIYFLNVFVILGIDLFCFFFRGDIRLLTFIFY